jgi:hypothetical protein
MLPDSLESRDLAAGKEGERLLAVLASVAEALADAFNWRYMHGCRRDSRSATTSSPPACLQGHLQGARLGCVGPALAYIARTPPGRPRVGDQWEGNLVNYFGELCPFWKRNDFVETAALRTL